MTQSSLIDPTTGLDALTMVPGEVRSFRVDFGNKLRDDTLSAVLSAAAVAQGDVVGAAAVTVASYSASGRYVNLTLSGGTDGERYVVAVSARTVGGYTLVGGGVLYVRSLS